MITLDLATANVHKLTEVTPDISTQFNGSEGKSVRADDFKRLQHGPSGLEVHSAQQRHQPDWPSEQGAVPPSDVTVVEPCNIVHMD